MPLGTLRGQQITAGKVCCGHVLMRSDSDERPFQQPRHVFEKACLAATGRALEHDRQPMLPGGSKDRDLVASTLIIRLSRDAIHVQIHYRHPWFDDTLRRKTVRRDIE